MGVGGLIPDDIFCKDGGERVEISTVDGYGIEGECVENLGGLEKVATSGQMK